MAPQADDHPRPPALDESSRASKPSPAPSDEYLVACVLSGDDAALRQIIDRYDRAVRYAIFRYTKDRCLSDPHWLDSVASSTWAGFVRSLRKEAADRPRSLATYLVTIAQRQSVSALRASLREKRRQPAVSLETAADVPDAAGSTPASLLENIERLELLRRCVDQLPEDERVLFTEFDAIIGRRWVEAAARLGASESTVRSKWARILNRLREMLGA